jgi:hypothetical protein
MNKNDAIRINQLGHRNYVGGNGNLWDVIAKLQYDYMMSQGLKPHNIFLDIACGSLRAGRLFIEYLNSNNYIGIEKEINLVIHGVAEELGIERFITKSPCFIISSQFEFEKLNQKPDYAIAQSLFTHLTLEDIELCISKLRLIAKKDFKFYATFFESDNERINPDRSDALECFFYTKNEIMRLANRCGWVTEYIGDWNHPRGQKMILFTPN